MAEDDIPIEAPVIPPTPPEPPAPVEMETRNVLNPQSVVIGTLSFPVGTSESVWTEALARYSTAIPYPTLEQIVTSKVQASINFGVDMIKSAATQNVITGITMAEKTKEVSDFLSNLERYLRSGSLYAAMDELDALASGEIPEDITTWVSAEKLLAAKLKIQRFLGL